MEDPNLQWNGSQWLRWDGQRWVDATTGQPTSTAGGTPPAEEPPGKANMWVGIAIGALAVLLVITVVVIVIIAVRPQDPISTTTPTPVPTSSTPTTPPTPSTYTLYFVNPDFPGGVYGAGVKTRGNQASGFVGIMQSGDLGCFNGTYSGGYLTGNLVIPPDGGGKPTTQTFKWKASGEGENFRLIAIGDVTPLREVPLATMNDYAAKGSTESWQPLFTSCAKLTGGLS